MGSASGVSVLTREKFGGMGITPKNRRTLMNSFMQDYIAANKEKEESGEITKEQLWKDAEAYAREHINFNNKMFRKYMKGDLFFRWKGRKERVITTEYLSRMQRFLQDLEEKYVESNNKKEEEE